MPNIRSYCSIQCSFVQRCWNSVGCWVVVPSRFMVVPRVQLRLATRSCRLRYWKYSGCSSPNSSIITGEIS